VRRVLITSLVLSIAGVMVAASMNGCSVGNGTGTVVGQLYVTDCWSGSYDLQPDFFAATPLASDDSLVIRIQHGSDYVNFSDGISILVTGVSVIRAAIDNDGGTSQAQNLSVTLPPSVLSPGVPLSPQPPGAQFALYMQQTCQGDTPGLYGMSIVTTNAGTNDGGALCTAATTAAASQCDGGASPPTLGPSTITFEHLFDVSLANGGDPGGLSAGQRLIQAHFDVLLGDPREECPGNMGPPAPCHGRLKGSFSFYFERGTPAQAFP